MIALTWHIFLVVWFSGGVVFIWRRYEKSSSKSLERQVRDQVLQTRLSELQARERKALDA